MIALLAALPEAEKAERFSPFERIAMLPFSARLRIVRELPKRLRGEFLLGWGAMARPAQEPPEQEWRVWLVQAGRGFGKTRAGAEWVLDMADAPGRRIALVGATEEEARAVMVEGPSGLLACVDDSPRPAWEPSLGRLTWPNGTIARLFSAANAEALRGPEHDFAWCDEVGKWREAEASWDNLMFGLRRGERPQVLATTTPRATPLMRRIAALPGLAITRGRTADNLSLARSVVDHVTALYGGTRLGRQELDGELVEDVEGSLWPRALIEAARAGGALPREDLKRVVIGVDPPASAGGDACGIVVCGLGRDGVGYVLADATVSGLRPEGWARAVVRAADAWAADRIVVETNQGGEMVETVLRSVDCTLPVRTAHARAGKVARAEPVAAWFEQGKAKLAGAFPALEDEMAGMTIDGRYDGPGRSPDRADAMVWAMTELLRKRTLPNVRFP